MNDNQYAAPEHELKKLDDPRPGAKLVKMGVVALVLLHFMPPASVILGAICWSRSKADLDKMKQGELSTEHGARSRTKAGLVLGIFSTILGALAIVALVHAIWERVQGI